MNFEYYYGTQADQFSFIRIPRILLLDEAFSALSLSAKVLYSVLLDRIREALDCRTLYMLRALWYIRVVKEVMKWELHRKKIWYIEVSK